MPPASPDESEASITPPLRSGYVYTPLRARVKPPQASPVPRRLRPGGGPCRQLPAQAARQEEEGQPAEHAEDEQTVIRVAAEALGEPASWVGAWTACPECKHTPDDLEDQAKHLMASDHYFSQADLDLISTRVQSGQPLHFNHENVAELVGMLKTQTFDKIWTAVFVFGFFAILALVVVGAIYLFARLVWR